MVSFTSILMALATAVVVQADYYIEPSSVSLSTRTGWCQNELSTCPQICQQMPPGTTKVNTCDAKTLTYGCICGNDMQPNVSEYSLTLPYFVCTEWGNQCVANCGNNNNCASDCRENHPCGAQDPSPPNSSVTAAAATATTSATAAASTTGQVYDGFGGSTSSNSGAAAVLAKGQMGGMLIVMGTLFVGFAFML